MKYLIIRAIKLYQSFISPSLGANCRFYPSCSEYTKQAVERFGVFRGLYLGIKRINRCSPENPEFGVDPVPIDFQIKK